MNRLHFFLVGVSACASIAGFPGCSGRDNGSRGRESPEANAQETYSPEGSGQPQAPYVVNPSDGYLYPTKSTTQTDPSPTATASTSSTAPPVTAPPPAASAAPPPAPSSSTPAASGAVPNANVLVGVAEGGLLYKKADQAFSLVKLRATNTDASSRLQRVEIELPSGSGFRLATATYPADGWTATVDRAVLFGSDFITFQAQAGGLAPGQSQEFDVAFEGNLPAPSLLLESNKLAAPPPLFSLGVATTFTNGASQAFTFPIH